VIRTFSTVEAIERKALWLALGIGIVLVLSGGLATYLARGIETWQLAVVLTSLFCQVAALTLVVAASAPNAYLRAELGRREQYLFFALVFFCGALVLLAVHQATLAYNVHTHGF
jgi:hypothetical protein